VTGTAAEVPGAGNQSHTTVIAALNPSAAAIIGALRAVEGDRP
jgi:hypothetical protein